MRIPAVWRIRRSSQRPSIPPAMQPMVRLSPSKRLSYAIPPSSPAPRTEPTRRMIDALKSDEIGQKMGGRFKLCALIQRRLKELIIDGARPLVERNGRTDLEIVIDEIAQDKITCDYSETGYAQVVHKPKKTR